MLASGGNGHPCLVPLPGCVRSLTLPLYIDFQRVTCYQACALVSSLNKDPTSDALLQQLPAHSSLSPPRPGYFVPLSAVILNVLIFSGRSRIQDLDIAKKGPTPSALLKVQSSKDQL